MKSVSQSFIGFLFFILSVFSINAIAVECVAIFPGSKSLSANGPASFGNNNTCNGSTCLPVQSFTPVNPLPTISPAGAFNSTSLNDGKYEHSSWGLGQNTSVNFSGTGTAVIYFSGSVIIPKNTKINQGGSPSNVLIIAAGSISISQGADISAHIYSAGAVSIDKNSDINGAISAVGGLSLNQNNTFNYNGNDVLAINPHGFCENSPPAVLVANYKFDVCDLEATGIATDSVGGFDGAITGSITRDSDATSGIKPETCSSASFEGGAVDIYGLPLSTDSGDKTSISFWMHWDGTNSVMPIGFNTHDLWFISGSFGFNTGNSDIYGISSAGLANGWHHVTAIFTNNDVTANQLYIDGVEQALTQRRSTPNNSRGVVDPHLRLGGWWRTNGYRFSGKIDEVKVYTGAVDQAQVDADVAYTAVSCPNCPPPPPPPPAELIAKYDFDNSGDADGTLKDVFGTFDGVQTGNVIQVDAPAEGLKGNTCSAGDFSGGAFDIYGLPLSTASGDYTSVSFWMKWDGTNSVMPIGFYLHDIWFYGGSFGFNSAAGDIYGMSSAGLANSWHHITVIFNNNKITNNKIYLDGVEQTLTQRRGNPNNSRAVVDPHMRIGGWWANNGYRFRGLLDEVQVYTGVLTDDEITDIYAEAHACPLASTAEWRLDELSWANTPGEVIDSSGSGHNGTAFGFGTGSADPQTSNTSPALSGNPGTCHYAEFDGVDDYVEITDGENLDNTDKLTLSAWFKADSFSQTNGTNARGLFSKRAAVSSDASYGAFFWNGRGNKLYVDIVGNNNRFGSNTNFSVDTWYHVAIVFDGTEPVNSRVKLYVNGLLDGTFAESSNFIPDTNSNFYIGNLFYSSSQLKVFDGAIDEVYVIPEALTASEVDSLMNTRRPCDSIQLFQIEHDARGLTCQSENVEITACSDANCNAVDTSVTTGVDLLINGNSTTVNIVNGRGTASFNYRDTVTPATVSLATDYLCFNNLDNIKGTSGSACQLTFSETGFIFSNIDNQVAGVPFSGVTVQAVADDSGVCTALVNDTTTIDMAMTYQSPTTRPSSGFAYSIDAVTVAGNETTLGTSPSAYSDITLAFNNAGTAPINNNKYDDAGQIRLHAKFVIPASGAEPAVTVEGSSNLFWVRPYRFDLSSSPTDIFPAGDFFTFAITAVNASGGTTTNYQQNDVELSVERTLPSAVATGSVDGSFVYQTSNKIDASLTPTYQDALGSVFIDGVYESTTASYTEVGTITVDARESNYGSVGQSIRTYNYTDPSASANPIVLGRFTPKYFTQTVQDHGSLIGQCGAWAYSGQKKVGFPAEGAITYGTVPQLRIVALNTQGEETKNYRSFGSENYMMLEDDSVVVKLPTFDVEENGALATKLALSASVTNQTNAYTAVSGGTHDYSFNMSDHFTYTRDANAVYKPFMAKFDLDIVSITDSDGVMDGNNAGIDSASLSPVLFRDDLLDPLDPLSLLENTIEIKYGRLVLENSYGPETSALPQVFRAEYLDDHLTSSFVVHEDDSCTQISNTETLWQFSNGDGLVSGDITINNASGVLSSGIFNGISLDSKKLVPTGKQGAIRVEYDTPEWLQFGWPTGVNASATATFGQYRGNDRIIYWRETN